MFNRGVDELLRALPQLEGLDADGVRRMLTRAWLEAVDLRDLGGPGVDGAESVRDLRRLATTLELYAILVNNIDTQTLRASAFVAAEALEVVAEVIALTPEEPRPWLFGTHSRFERVEAGLLYLIAGYDANAALIGQSLNTPGDEEEVEEAAISLWVFEAVRALLRLQLPPDEQAPPSPGADQPLRDRVRHAIWARLGSAVRSHLQWLTLGSDDDEDAILTVRDLIAELERQDDGQDGGVQHADLHHLAQLLVEAMDGTAGRALRAVPPPPEDGGRFGDFQRRRALSRPLLWPAAAEYAERALPGPQAHAVVSVPTGAGKSAVAELAIAQAIRNGWVLYLSPTNALAGQIRRQLNEVVGQLAGVTIREFVGGVEYTELEGEDLGVIGDRQVLVMTPEKCSLALRQNPEAFGRMALCVVDEAHILGEPGGRAVIAELVLAEVLHRAPQARVLMLSALLANPVDVADWLANATGITALVVNSPWRPTRTLRAIAGFDLERSNEAATQAAESMKTLPPHRKNITFGAPLALFAGLQGAWRTSELVDFAFVSTTIEAPIKYHREKGLIFDGYLNPTVQALVQGLGENRHRVLAFLPRNKHYSFLAAHNVPGFAAGAPVELGSEIDALLTLADAELGARSALWGALGKRVGVHTSAMLHEERRASELAFERELAWVMFATGTMAQGLNLPATAVVIGGTKIGFDPSITGVQERGRERAQLLNAIGRAGRANVAPRSMAIVVPDNLIAFSTETDATSTIQRADFLREEDASTEVHSQLDGLIARALDGTLDMAGMSSAEQVAFTFLSYAAEGDDAQGVLRRSWAVQRAAAAGRADEIAQVLGRLGAMFLESRSAPEWVALAAHRSGLALPETAGFYSVLRQLLLVSEPPTTVREWASAMIAVLRTIPAAALERALPSKPFKSTRLEPIWDENLAQRNEGWIALQATLNSWFDGLPLLEVAAQIERKDPAGNAGRGQQDPLPRTLRVVTDGFGFGLSIVAGALGAIVAAGRESDPDGPWQLPADSARSLALLPLAVRFGAGTPSVIAWMRTGVRPRVVAHLLDRLVEAPSDIDDEDLRLWASRQLNDIRDGFTRLAATDAERALVAAMLVGRRAT